MFTVFYESLKGRGKAERKGLDWGAKGRGPAAEERGRERGSERKRRQACIESRASGAKP